MADSTNVILFLMFFTTTEPPPVPNATQQDRVWTLQSTQAMTFSSMEACERVGNQVVATIKPVKMLTVRPWCFSDVAAMPLDMPQSDSPANGKAARRKGPSPDRQLTPPSTR